MAASTWRMNGTWRGLALAFFFYALLLNNGVKCDPTDSPGTAATDSPAGTGVTGSQSPVDSDSTDGGVTDAPAAEGETGLPFHVSIMTGLPDIDATVGPLLDAGSDTQGTEVTDAPAAEPETKAPLRLVVPDVECVDKETIEKKDSVKAVVTTTDCEETKNLMKGNPAPWCEVENCQLEIFQEGNTLMVASSDAQPNTLADALRSESMKGPLGVSEVNTPSSSGSSVFVAVLLTGLLLAAALIGGYCLKCRGSDPKGVRLAEEAYPAEDANQGNTLVSVAPLNPPAETQEKPSVNGESPEEPKTPPPPTNGHSTAKTADTEL